MQVRSDEVEPEGEERTALLHGRRQLRHPRLDGRPSAQVERQAGTHTFLHTRATHTTRFEPDDLRESTNPRTSTGGPLKLMRLFGITAQTAMRHVGAACPERTAKLPRQRARSEPDAS
ncbi:hypothetical protein [Streptomyces sp. NPDC058579]|uniref:hypothetical protein n=1 Tax=Streptomyces sp. NPDC058579 TaxID=3346548 RepID=UPI00366830C1